jgi:hypothetical protein
MSNSLKVNAIFGAFAAVACAAFGPGTMPWYERLMGFSIGWYSFTFVLWAWSRFRRQTQ